MTSRAQPLCVRCWTAFTGRDAPLNRSYEDGQIERCVMCGYYTRSGIYELLPERELPFPLIKDEEDE